MKTRFKNVFALAVLVSLPFSGFAAENCMNPLKEILTSIDHQVAKDVNLDAHVNHRLFVTNYAKKNGIPVFVKQNQMGEEIPIVLVNRESAKKMGGFVNNSYGTEVALQPGYGNDHGLMRMGNAIIDLDAPGYRGYGEIQKTGLAWKEFNSYMERRKPGHGVTLEVAYLLTPDERKTIDLYQRIRRAAIFRVKFSFKDFKTEDQPFLLKGGGEHCFIFCKAQAVTSHISELQGYLQQMGVTNVEEYMNKAEVQTALKNLQEIVLNTHPDKLSPEIIGTKEALAHFKGLYPKEVVSDEQKAVFLRWVMSYDGSKNYNRVLKDLGVTSDYGLGDARNSRVSAVLVYDEDVNPQQFNQAVYKSEGAFTSWPTGAQKPVE